MIEKTIVTIPILGAFERAGDCPLCLLWNEAEESSLVSVEANEIAMDPDFRKKVIAAAGFCNRHMHRLFEESFSGHTENGLAYALYSKDVLDSLEAKLGDLRSRLSAERSRGSRGFLDKRNGSRKAAKDVASGAAMILQGKAICPICQTLLDSDTRTLTTFLNMLRDEVFASSYARSKGICQPHFASALGLLAKEKDSSDSVTTLLFRVQLDGLANLKAVLDDRIRKYAWEHRDEALSSEEADAQRAALRVIAGAEGLYCRERKAPLSS